MLIYYEFIRLLMVLMVILPLKHYFQIHVFDSLLVMLMQWITKYIMSKKSNQPQPTLPGKVGTSLYKKCLYD